MFTYQSVTNNDVDSEMVEQFRKAYDLRHRVRRLFDGLQGVDGILDMREHDKIVLSKLDAFKQSKREDDATVHSLKHEPRGSGENTD